MRIASVIIAAVVAASCARNGAQSHVATVASRPSECRNTTDPSPRPSAINGPSLRTQQAWVREYYPGLAKYDAPARLVVGFVVDSNCHVLQHSAAIVPDSLRANSDALLPLVFPSLQVATRASGAG